MLGSHSPKLQEQRKQATSRGGEWGEGEWVKILRTKGSKMFLTTNDELTPESSFWSHKFTLSIKSLMFRVERTLPPFLDILIICQVGEEVLGLKPLLCMRPMLVLHGPQSVARHKHHTPIFIKYPLSVKYIFSHQAAPIGPQ